MTCKGSRFNNFLDTEIWAGFFMKIAFSLLALRQLDLTDSEGDNAKINLKPS
jgi:hypothetical protein